MVYFDPTQNFSSVSLCCSPVHLQGNLNLPTFVARKNKQRGEGEVPLNTFTGLCESRKKKNPDPNVEGEQWINPGAGLKIKAYMKKYKEVFGPESDPASQDIDGTVSAMCGQGRKGGRLLVGDGAIPRKEIPTLSHLRATLRSSGPAIERRPQPSMDLLQQFQARLDEEARQRQEAERLRQEAEARSAQMQQAMLDQQQALMQQQEFMAKQQQALQETFARFRSQMDGTGLPELPILPPLPTFGIIPQPGQGSNNFVVGGSTPGQGSPKTPTVAHGHSTSTQQ